MPMRNAVITVASAGIVVVLIFYKVSLNVEFQLPHDVQAPDAEQEARYRECIAERDAQIHQQAFDTIDNPDVQREYITMHRDQARQECRARYPQQAITTRQPLRFNLLDLEPRFGLHYANQGDNTAT